jgi:hypothetical protein
VASNGCCRCRWRCNDAMQHLARQAVTAGLAVTPACRRRVTAATVTQRYRSRDVVTSDSPPQAERGGSRSQTMTVSGQMGPNEIEDASRVRSGGSAHAGGSARAQRDLEVGMCTSASPFRGTDWVIDHDIRAIAQSLVSKWLRPSASDSGCCKKCVLQLPCADRICSYRPRRVTVQRATCD